MNEVTKIHLGREEFSISNDAFHELKKYLADIKAEIKDSSVVDEIELRMAELLLEHGVSSSKVILSSDVGFLKQQLGSPTDFKEDEDESEKTSHNTTENKKLFRDTDKAMVAGVAAGLAEYFGIEVLFVRLLFVIAVIITVGWGILLYIVLWLLVPEAKSPSDKLLMVGKPVNVNSLKEIVEKADVKGVANRVNSVLSRPINNVFRIFLKLVGLFFMVIGLSIVFGLITAITYYISRSTVWSKTNIFPIGLREDVLLYILTAIIALISVFIILFGVAIFRRKWPIHTWVTGMLVGLILIGFAVSGALTAVVYPGVKDRYNVNDHTSIRAEQAFSQISIVGDGSIDINFTTSNLYSVSLSYYSVPNLNNIKTFVKNGTLFIDYSQFNNHRNCQTICIPSTYNVMLTVNSPNALQLSNQFGDFPVVPTPPAIPKIME